MQPLNCGFSKQYCSPLFLDVFYLFSRNLVRVKIWLLDITCWSQSRESPDTNSFSKVRLGQHLATCPGDQVPNHGIQNIWCHWPLRLLHQSLKIPSDYTSAPLVHDIWNERHLLQDYTLSTARRKQMTASLAFLTELRQFPFVLQLHLVYKGGRLRTVESKWRAGTVHKRLHFIVFISNDVFILSALQKKRNKRLLQ